MSFGAREFGDQFRGQRVLVTGATGFIGRHLCEALASLGGMVTGLSRSAGPSNISQGVIPLAADLRQYGNAYRVLGQVHPDVIFHLAGHVTAQRDRELVIPMLETNAAGTVHLLMAASKVGCARFVIVSSAEVCGPGAIPGSPYAASKLVAEIYGQMFYQLYGLPVVCLRPYLTYGPGQQPTKLIPHTILSLLRGENPYVTSSDRTCDVIYVEDVVRGFLKAAVTPDVIVGERIDLGTGVGITIREVVQKVAKLIDSPGCPIFGAAPDRPNEGNIVADFARTQSILAWSPSWSLDDGLQETVAWYRESARSGGRP